MRSSTGKVQECKPYLSDYITTPVALVQHCSGRGSSTEEQQEAAAAAAGRLRSISLVCNLHTLHNNINTNNIAFDSCQIHTGATVRPGPNTGATVHTCTFARSE